MRAIILSIIVLSFVYVAYTQDLNDYLDKINGEIKNQTDSHENTTKEIEWQSSKRQLCLARLQESETQNNEELVVLSLTCALNASLVEKWTAKKLELEELLKNLSDAVKKQLEAQAALAKANLENSLLNTEATRLNVTEAQQNFDSAKEETDFIKGKLETLKDSLALDTVKQTLEKEKNRLSEFLKGVRKSVRQVKEELKSALGQDLITGLRNGILNLHPNISYTFLPEFDFGNLEEAKFKFLQTIKLQLSELATSEEKKNVYNEVKNLIKAYLLAYFGVRIENIKVDVVLVNETPIPDGNSTNNMTKRSVSDSDLEVKAEFEQKTNENAEQIQQTSLDGVEQTDEDKGSDEENIEDDIKKFKKLLNGTKEQLQLLKAELSTPDNTTTNGTLFEERQISREKDETQLEQLRNKTEDSDLNQAIAAAIDLYVKDTLAKVDDIKAFIAKLHNDLDTARSELRKLKLDIVNKVESDTLLGVYVDTLVDQYLYLVMKKIKLLEYQLKKVSDSLEHLQDHIASEVEKAQKKAQDYLNKVYKNVEEVKKQWKANAQQKIENLVSRFNTTKLAKILSIVEKKLEKGILHFTFDLKRLENQVQLKKELIDTIKVIIASEDGVAPEDINVDATVTVSKKRQVGKAVVTAELGTSVDSSSSYLKPMVGLFGAFLFLLFLVL